MYLQGRGCHLLGLMPVKLIGANKPLFNSKLHTFENCS
jgi:hypothetical protein